MALSQPFPTSENSNSLCQSGGKNALKMECIKQDRKRHNFGLLPADDSPFSPPPPAPATECLLTGVHRGPGCQLEYP